MTNILIQIDRLKQVYNGNTDVSLARALGVDKNTVSVWKNRNEIPANVLKKVAQDKNVSMDWLLGIEHNLAQEVVLNTTEDPLKAICYIEGYMQHLLKMQGETMDEELNNRFKTIHEFINASQVVTVCNQQPLTIQDEELEKARWEAWIETRAHLNSIR